MAPVTTNRHLAVLGRTTRDVTIAVLVTFVACEAIVRIGGFDPGEVMVMVDIDPVSRGESAHWPMPSRYDPDGNGLREEGLAQPPGEATRVVILGDSILFGVHLPPNQRVGALLSRTFAVDDLAAPGYSTTQMRLAFGDYLQKHRPDVVVLSVFHNDSANWVQVGSGVRRGCLRFRIPLSGGRGARLDPATAWWLYRRSAVFRATCRPWIYTDRVCQEASEQTMIDEAKRIAAMTRKVGARLLAVVMTDTDGDWDTQIRRRPTIHTYDVITQSLQRRGATVVEALEILSKLPEKEVALDTTGHLKAAGHQALSAAIEAEISGKKRP